jgi:hypothetical protein
MENLVVATFKNIIDATEGLNKLKDLDKSNEITIYNILVTRKKSDDLYQLLYYEGIDIVHLPEDSQLTALLSHMLDQPLRLASNIFLGLLERTLNSREGAADLSNGLPDQFNQELRLSTFSILLDAEEDNPSYIDDYMRPYQGVAWRSNIVDLYHKFVEDQLLRQRMGGGKSIEPLNTWINRITTQLNARIAILKEKINVAEDAVKDKLGSQMATLEQKVKNLNEYLRNW